MASILYITYDGLMEPLGTSQVWQYLKILSRAHKIVILSFEKFDDLSNKDKLESYCNELEAYGVSWYRLKYHKTPNIIATAFDILTGVFLSAFIVYKYKVKIIHARSYVSALITFITKKISNIEFIFDMRGFWADEKVDGGVWSNKALIYRITKKLECKFLLSASSIVTLTNAGRNDVLSLSCMRHIKKRIEVIPTCVNLKIFYPQDKTQLIKKDVNHIFTLGYVGSVGTFYLFDEVLKSFKMLLKVKKNSKLLIINQDQHDYIHKKVSRMGISNNYVEIKSVAYNEVANEISRMDAGIFYIKPSFSKRSSSPTKLGEFLGCGKPCISNFGVGDTELVLQNENVGIVLKGFSDNDHTKGVNDLLALVEDEGIRERCIYVAKEYYSLEMGVEKYNDIYEG